MNFLYHKNSLVYYIPVPTKMKAFLGIFKK